MHFGAGLGDFQEATVLSGTLGKHRLQVQRCTMVTCVGLAVFPFAQSTVLKHIPKHWAAAVNSSFNFNSPLGTGD